MSTRLRLQSATFCINFCVTRNGTGTYSHLFQRQALPKIKILLHPLLSRIESKTPCIPYYSHKCYSLVMVYTQECNQHHNVEPQHVQCVRESIQVHTAVWQLHFDCMTYIQGIYNVDSVDHEQWNGLVE